MQTKAPNQTGDEAADTLRERIILAAAHLIAADGPDAATTRAVAAAANVQAPAIYRIFGDKRGLMDAVAHDGLARYVAEKALRDPHPDPVEELRHGWDVHIAFGLTHPGLYTIMSSDSGSRAPSPAAIAGDQLLRRKITTIARAGRLKVSEDRAVGLLYAACVGTVLSLLRQPEARRDLTLSIDAREAVMSAIAVMDDSKAASNDITAAIALRAFVDRSRVLTAGERHLLKELLDRIAAPSG